MLSYLAGRSASPAWKATARKAPINDQTAMKYPLSTSHPVNRPKPVFSESYPVAFNFRHPVASTTAPVRLDPLPWGLPKRPLTGRPHRESHSLERARTGRPGPRAPHNIPIHSAALLQGRPAGPPQINGPAAPRPTRIPRSRSPPEKPPTGRLGNADVTTVTKSSPLTTRKFPNKNSLRLP